MANGTSTETTTALGTAAGTLGDGAKVDPVVEGGKVAEGISPEAAAKVAAEKVAAELAAKPFLDVAQLKLADGAKLDEAAMKDFLPLAKEHGLTAKQAQALLELDLKRGAAMETARVAAQSAAHEAAAKASLEALKGDKEIGGANFDKSMKLATQALQRFGSPELKQALNEVQLADGSMLGDSLVFARLLVSVGKSMAEDTTGGTHGNGAKTAANDAGTLQRSIYTHPTSQGLKFD